MTSANSINSTSTSTSNCSVVDADVVDLTCRTQTNNAGGAAFKLYAELQAGDILTGLDSNPSINVIKRSRPLTSATTGSNCNYTLYPFGAAGLGIALPTSIRLVLTLVAKPSVTFTDDGVTIKWYNAQGIQRSQLKTEAEIATFCCTTPKSVLPDLGTIITMSLADYYQMTDEWKLAWPPKFVTSDTNENSEGSEVNDNQTQWTVLNPYLVGYFCGWGVSHSVFLEAGSLYSSIINEHPDQSLMGFYNMFLSDIDPPCEYTFTGNSKTRLEFLAGIIDSNSTEGQAGGRFIHTRDLMGQERLKYLEDLCWSLGFVVYRRGNSGIEITGKLKSRIPVRSTNLTDSLANVWDGSRSVLIRAENNGRRVEPETTVDYTFVKKTEPFVVTREGLVLAISAPK